MATVSINTMLNANEFVSRLNSVITNCRDILRREGITGMDSMKHMTMYILARTLDRVECQRLNISTDFAWEKFLEFAAADRKQDCYNLLYNSNGTAPDLITHLDSKFGTKNFNFKLKGPDNHVAIIKHLNSLENFRQIDGAVDILGTVYEHHLGSGSNKSAMRDLGQFFTDRRVCNYMTKLCNPHMVSDGIAESVLDPTMGTGGFLTSYVKHLINQGRRIDWSKMQQDVAGYDIDEFVMSIGRINMYLSTGIIFDRIAHRNTLQNDVGDRGQRMNFKIILANEPFGVKGLLYRECCQRVKDMGIDGTKSEPLFLNLIMAGLDDGGRCAVVVPDGVLTNDSKQHTGTRKYLLDHFELRRVIKMKGQFFSNTGIQPSILFFENTGRPTSVVEFWEVEQDKTGAVIDTMLLSVNRERFDAKYCLDVRQYEMKKVLINTGGFPVVKLSTVCDYKNGSTLDKADKNDDGEFNVMGGGMDYVGKYNNFNCEGYTITISKSGASAGFVKEHHDKFWAGDCFSIYSKVDSLNKKFLYYILKLNPEITNSKITGSTIPHCKWSDICDSLICVPPLSIQQEIVSALDLIYTNAESARKSVESVKAQMGAVMRSITARGYEQRTLGEVFDVKGGKAINKENLTGSKYPYYGCNGINGYVDEYLFDGEYIICAQDGSIGSVYIVNNKFYPSNHTHVIKSKNDTNFLNMFGTYYLKYCVDWKPLITSIIPKVTQAKLLDIDICVPPLPIQQEILTILNTMEAERVTLEQMAAKAEQRAKYILDNYLNPVSQNDQNTIEP